ncbi:MAG: hypothetical protein GXO90_10605 [FCB group bacterium]|nr:hypothetical protein [FCB group bacterium]
MWKKYTHRWVIFVLVAALSTTIHGGETGFGLTIGGQGSGIFIRHSRSWRPKMDLGLEAHFIDVTGENEFKLVDPYTGTPYTFNGQSLVLIPLFINGTYFPFEGQIDNQFSPFVTAKAGFLIAADGDESIDRWVDRWRQPDIIFAPALQLGGGIRFMLPMNSLFSMTVAYSIYPMPKSVDGRRNYNGMSFQFGFSR